MEDSAPGPPAPNGFRFEPLKGRGGPPAPRTDMSPGLLPGEPRRVVRVFPDHADWPLWENSTEWRDSPYTMTPEDYRLSRRLTDLIRSWDDYWYRHFRWDTGWSSPAHESEWVDAKTTILALLRSEVEKWADVRDETSSG
jgi:hypothetical protein